ncbi:unnamed protein product, partial [Adineta steineri]
EQRQSSRLDWAESSCTRWLQIPLYSWITPILSLSNKRTLVENDLDDLAIKDQCSTLLNRVNQYDSQWPGTWHVLNHTFAKDFLMSILLVFPLIMAHLAQPLLIRQIILVIKDQSGLPWYDGYIFCIALFASCIVQAIVVFRYRLNSRLKKNCIGTNKINTA